MAIMIIPCPKCGKQIEMHVGQSFINLRVNTYASYHCKHCGECIEMDWFGEKPNQEIVDAILEQDGTWEISIVESQSDKVSIMKVLRDELNMKISELKNMIKDIGKFKYQGTDAEVAKFEYAFKKVGIKTSIVRLN